MSPGIVYALVCLAFLIGYLVGRQSKSKSVKVDPLKNFQPPTPTKLDVTDWSKLQQLINDGQKIQAIKFYRQLTGDGLKESKEFVERLENSPRILNDKEDFERLKNNPTKLDDRNLNELRQMMRNGQKIQAIKLYRQLTGAGLKEAKESVERLERERY